jgi:hypothetical protein
VMSGESELIAFIEFDKIWVPGRLRSAQDTVRSCRTQ